MDLTVVSTAGVVATAVATAISAVFALWTRRADRPEADWAFTPESVTRNDGPYGGSDRRPRMLTRLSNAGDGTAFRLTAKGVGCDVGLLTPSIGGSGNNPRSVVPAMRPGDEVFLWAKCDEETWDKARVIIEWTPSPTRKRKRIHQEEKLSDLGEVPPPRDQESS